MAEYDRKFCSGPESLTKLCYKFICNNFSVIANNKGSVYQLRGGVVLSNEICEKLVEFAKDSELRDKGDAFFNIFVDVKATNLKQVKINGFDIKSSSVAIIASHRVTDLEFIDCKYLDWSTIEYINMHSENLINLSIRNCKNLLSTSAGILF